VNVKGASAPVDVSHLFPNGAPKSLQGGAGREDSSPLGRGGSGINL
jgi:hypothetical protein